MRITSVLFRGTGLRVERLQVNEEGIGLLLAAGKARAPCPACGVASRRLHSRYARTVTDVAWGGAPVRCRLLVRRLRCGRAACPQRIFCERLGDFAAAHARRTDRLRALLRDVGFALGGRPGQRLLPALRATASRTTLLRLVRAADMTPPVDSCGSAPRILGVDEWAFRRGPRERRFGTILLDLERHRPVDLLRDATAEGFAAWLRTHPGACVISRDRGGAFADGARTGAPGAVQVADRFHLLRNLGDVTKRVFHRHAAAVRQVQSPNATPATLPAGSVAGVRGGFERTDGRESRERTRQVLRERYQAIHELAARGMNASAIARALGVHRHTVQKYLPLTAPPERRYTQRRPSILAPYERYLLERWRQQGRTDPRRRRNALALWRELRQRGFTGKYGSVVRLVAHWNRLERAGEAVPMLPRGLTPRHATALLLVRSHRRTADEQRAVDAVRTVHPEVATAMALFDGFAQLIRDVRRDSLDVPTEDPAALRAAREDRLARLDGWLGDAARSGVIEMRAFGTRLRQDLTAVQAALTLPYSQGQTEGHITRLKLLKRQMYGRANFDLLRLRFLAAHPA